MTGRDSISESELKRAYLQAAKVVTEHGEKYLPLFERMQEEYESHKQKSELIKQAIYLASSLKL